MMRVSRSAVLPLFLVLLVGCGQSPGGASPQVDPAVQDYASTAKPADPELASLYQRSCRQCHSIAGTNAPLTGDTAAWQARLDLRGMDGLLNSTKSGIGVMPPKGMCYSCTDEQFTALIRFMLSESQ